METNSFIISLQFVKGGDFLKNSYGEIKKYIEKEILNLNAIMEDMININFEDLNDDDLISYVDLFVDTKEKLFFLHYDLLMLSQNQYDYKELYKDKSALKENEDSLIKSIIKSPTTTKWYFSYDLCIFGDITSLAKKSVKNILEVEENFKKVSGKRIFYKEGNEYVLKIKRLYENINLREIATNPYDVIVGEVRNCDRMTSLLYDCCYRNVYNNQLKKYNFNALCEVLTVTEAAELWNRSVGNLRKEFALAAKLSSDSKFKNYEIRKSGATWFVLKEAMYRVFGCPGKIEEF